METALDILESIFLKNGWAFEEFVGHCGIYDLSSFPELFSEIPDEQELLNEYLKDARSEEEGIAFVIKLLKKNGQFIQALEGRVATLIPEIILAAIPTFPTAWEYAAPSLQDDLEFIRNVHKIICK